MQRFEFKDGKSSKFWEVEVEGDAVTFRYGKIGTDGRVETKTFASAAKAEAEADKKIREKTKKGYVEVAAAAPAADGGGAAKAGKKHSQCRHPTFEAAIVANPDSEQHWQVYADWLESQGDPWGQRISLEIQRDKAKGPAKKQLDEQLTALVDEQREHFYGKSLPKLLKADDFDEVATVEWKYGLLRSVRVASPEYDWSGTAPATVLRALVESPAARLLSAITIGLMESEYPVSLNKGIDAISKAGKLEALTDLFIGDFEYPDEQEISWVAVGKVGKLFPAMPNLRSLHVRGGEIDLGTLELPKLERLLIETGGLPKAAVASVGKCKLPALTSMEVWFGRDEYGGNGKVSQLAPLFTGAGLPKLTHLGLKNCEFQDDIAIALAKSKILAQLRSVDMSMGTLHEPGVEAILANAEAFSHLESLDLRENYISDELAERLSKAFGAKVDWSDQDEPDEWDDERHYYTTVGE